MKTVHRSKHGSLNANAHETLLQRAANGDEKAFRTLVERTNYWIIALLTFLLQNADEAKDISQEFWIKVWKKLKNNRYHEEGKSEEWLRTVLYNTLRDELKKKNRHLHLEMTPEIEEEYGSADEGLQRVEAMQWLAVAEKYMDKLVIRIVNMHVIEDMTNKEIAAKLHKPVKVVKKLYREGIAELKHILGPQHREMAH